MPDGQVLHSPSSAKAANLPAGQGEEEVVTVLLSADRSSGIVVSRYTEGLAWPATAARVGNDLVVVNTQFNTRADDTATRPFSLLRIPVSLLAGQ